MAAKFFAVVLLLLSFSAFSQCTLPQHDGTLIFTADTAADCSGYWLIPASEYSAYLSAVEITVADVASAFTWGFGTMVFLSFLSYKVRVATSVIRKI